MPKLNCFFIPYHNTGGHFVNWSVEFLSGQQTYFSRKQIRPVVTAADLTGKRNAHSHQMDVVSGYQSLVEFANKVTDIDINHVNVYAVPILDQDLAIQEYNASFEDLTQTLHKELFVKKRADASQIIELAQQQHKLVFIDYSKQDHLNVVYNNRYPMDFKSKKGVTADQMWDSYKDGFHKDIDSTFSSDYIWDKREKLALMLQPPKHNDFYSLVNKSLPHLYYNTDDIWNDLPNVVLEIIDFVGLTLVLDNLEPWQDAYNKWRQLHDNFFSRNFDRIIDAIVNKNYMSLKRYRLNFYQEALIQHALISRHNLNLKTWQLEKFPDNTLELHHLLEPSIHHL